MQSMTMAERCRSLHLDIPWWIFIVASWKIRSQRSSLTIANLMFLVNTEQWAVSTVNRKFSTKDLCVEKSFVCHHLCISGSQTLSVFIYSSIHRFISSACTSTSPSTNSTRKWFEQLFAMFAKNMYIKVCVVSSHQNHVQIWSCAISTGFGSKS